VDYARYQIVPTVARGPNEEPRMYLINEQFKAVPMSGGPRNYTFTVTCTIQPIATFNLTVNTTDDTNADIFSHMHQDTIVGNYPSPSQELSGQIGGFDPKNPIKATITGLRPDGRSPLGNELKLTISLTDTDAYSDLAPLNCKYYNALDGSHNMPFVSDFCSRPFPIDPDGYFGIIKRVNSTNWELNFRTFAFDISPETEMGIYCEVVLCIDTNKTMSFCYQEC